MLGGEYFGTFNEKITEVDDGSTSNDIDVGASNDIDDDVDDHNETIEQNEECGMDDWMSIFYFHFEFFASLVKGGNIDYLLYLNCFVIVVLARTWKAFSFVHVWILLIAN